jgi:ubiquitin carboxyl-terminal hydrolase 4/11
MYSYVTVSCQDSVKTLGRHLAGAFPSRALLPHRLWLIEAAHLEGSTLEGSEYPPAKLLAHGALMVDENDQTIEQALLESEDTFVVEFKHGPDWIVDAVAVLGKGSNKMQPEVPPPLFSTENDFFNSLKTNISLPSSSKASTAPLAMNDFVSKVPLSSPFSRSVGLGPSNSNSRPQEPGTIGLGNM